jgi:ParB family chromosome partitioning protein
MPKASRDSLNNKGKKDTYTFDPEDLVLVTDEKHPLFDERVHLPVNENLVLNMMHAPDGTPQGCLQPVTVARDRETGKLLVAIGRQRVKAAREANKRLKKAGLEPFWISAQISNDARSPHRGMGMLISENEHREDDSPLGKAKKAQRYLDLGRDVSEIAVLFGMSAASVKNMLSLLEAPAAVRNAVEAGKISTSDGYKLAKLEPEEAKEKVAELIEHAPRTPGKKRSGNAKKARKIVNGGNGEVKISKKAEDSVATDIAAWIDANYEIGETFPDLIKCVRSGKWREIRG